MTMTALPKKVDSPEGLAAAVRDAAGSGAQVRISGSASMPLTAFDERRPVQAISTLRMNKLIEHAVPDMTVIVHAGMTLEALQKHLAWHNQWLPIDPPAVNGRNPMQRTLGGILASNSLGPLRMAFGDWRMLLLGAKWVDATGTIAKGGGRTVKNAAGYHTPRLLVGSCGSLGAYCELTLRTYARPVDEQCVIFFCRDAAHAEELTAAILTSPTNPAYIEAIGGATFSRNPLQLPTAGAGTVVLAVGFLDRPSTCAAQIETVRALGAAARTESISQTAAQAGRLRLWLTSEPASTLAVRMHGLSSDAAGCVAKFEALAPEAFVVAEAGTGVVRASFKDVDPLALWPKLLEMLPAHATLVPIQGVTVAPVGAGLLDRLKKTLDPAGVFGLPPR